MTATLFRDHEYGALAVALQERNVVLWDHNLVSEDAQAVRRVLGRYARLTEGHDNEEHWSIRRDVYAPAMMNAIVAEMRGRGYGHDPLGERATLEQVPVEEAQAPDLPSTGTPLVHDAVERGVRQHFGLAVAALREHGACSAPSLRFHDRPNAARSGIQRPPFVVARMFTGEMDAGKARDAVLEALKPLKDSIVRLSVTEADEGNAVEVGLCIPPDVLESYLDSRLPVFEHEVTGARDVLYALESVPTQEELKDLSELARVTTAATSIFIEEGALVARVPSGFVGAYISDRALMERMEWLGRMLDPWGGLPREVGELTEVNAPTPEPERKALSELGECAGHDHPPMKTVAMMMEEEDCEEQLTGAGMTPREAILTTRAWDYELKQGGTPSSWIHRVQESTGRSHVDVVRILNEAADPNHNWQMANTGLVKLKQKVGDDPSLQREVEDIRKLVKDSRGSDPTKLRLARRRVSELASKVLRNGDMKTGEFASKIDMQLMSYMIRKGLEESTLDEAEMPEPSKGEMQQLARSGGVRIQSLKDQGTTASGDRRLDLYFPNAEQAAKFVRHAERRYGFGSVEFSQGKIRGSERNVTVVWAPEFYEESVNEADSRLRDLERRAVSGGPEDMARYRRASARSGGRGQLKVATLRQARSLAGSGPFRAPHYTASAKAMMDEVELAQGGVLFLDDLSAFRKLVLERIAQAVANSPDVVLAVEPFRATHSDRGEQKRWEQHMAILRRSLREGVDEARPSALKLQHDRIMARALKAQGTSYGRPIDPDEYPPIKGMEGPFQFRKSGRILYYDPRAGKYYDSKDDLYVDSRLAESLDEGDHLQNAIAREGEQISKDKFNALGSLWEYGGLIWYLSGPSAKFVNWGKPAMFLKRRYRASQFPDVTPEQILAMESVNEADADIRDLERRAVSGDPDAEAALRRAKQRLSDPVFGRTQSGKSITAEPSFVGSRSQRDVVTPFMRSMVSSWSPQDIADAAVLAKLYSKKRGKDKAWGVRGRPDRFAPETLGFTKMGSAFMDLLREHPDVVAGAAEFDRPGHPGSGIGWAAVKYTDAAERAFKGFFRQAAGKKRYAQAYFSESVNEAVLDEAWDADGVKRAAGSYGMNSPLGTIRVKKGRGDTFHLVFGKKRDFTGTAAAVAKHLNTRLGLDESLDEATYKQAMSELMGGLKVLGWSVVSHLKIPHATSPDRATRIWFKKQAIYAGPTKGGMKEARSLHVDAKRVTPEKLAADAEDHAVFLKGLRQESVVARKKVENAIYRKFPRGNKGKIGDKKKVMFTGSLARVMGRSAYDNVALSDMTNAEVEKLARATKAIGPEDEVAEYMPR